MDAQNLSLESIVSTAISIPGVKVSRNSFLTECFKNEAVDVHKLLDEGPIGAGCSQEMLKRLADKLIFDRTTQSSALSFMAGLPGGLAMGAAIPADVLQYFAVALRLAQELSYLYGAEDLWRDGELDSSLVNGQLILYCGVMFGASGASNGVRLLSAQIAKTTAKKLPQQALTKTFWYPIVKQVGKAIGVKVTKSTVASGISKAIPVVGGVISGSITFASMMPMGKRLAATLDDACFDYSDEEIQEDIAVIEEMSKMADENDTETTTPVPKQSSEKTNGLKKLGNGMSGIFSKAQNTLKFSKNKKVTDSEEDVFVKIEKLAKLRDMGALTQEEFDTKKAELLTKI